MSDMNSCHFTGRLGRDPESKKLPGSGDTVTSFSIAVSKQWRDKAGEKQERTTWVNVKCFGKLAEIVAMYATKGQQVRVSGELEIRKYQDQSGNDRYATEINMHEFQMLGGRQDGAGGSQAAPQQREQRQAAPRPAPAPAADQGFEDDIPF